MPSRKPIEERASTKIAEAEAARAAKEASAAAIKKATGGMEFDPVSKPDPIMQPTPIFQEEKPATNVEELLEQSTTPYEKPEEQITENPFGENYYMINSSSLPSKGLFYESEIYLRNFKVIEIKQLATTNTNNADKTLNRILKSLVKGVNYEDLLIVDKLALIFYIRVNTFPDPKYQIQFECTNMLEQYDDLGEVKLDAEGEPVTKQCKHPGKLHFTAGDFKIKSLDDDFTPDVMKFSLENGDDITWGFARVSDELAIARETQGVIDQLKENDLTDDEIDKDLISQAYMIDNINGNKLSLLDKYLYLTEIISSGDFIQLLKEIGKTSDIGVDTNISTTCEECGGQVSVPVMFSSEFFFPTYFAG